MMIKIKFDFNKLENFCFNFRLFTLRTLEIIYAESHSNACLYCENQFVLFVSSISHARTAFRVYWQINSYKELLCYRRQWHSKFKLIQTTTKVYHFRNWKTFAPKLDKILLKMLSLKTCFCFFIVYRFFNGQIRTFDRKWRK